MIYELRKSYENTKELGSVRTFVKIRNFVESLIN